MNPINKFVQFLIDHSPVICTVCKKAIFKKDAIMEQSNLGIFVPLCEECREKIFNPLRSANSAKTCWYLDKICPKCQKIGLVNKLTTNGKDIWCENTKCNYRTY